MADRDFILAPPTSTVKVSFELEPVYNAINSLSLLATHETRSGLGEWITRTAAEMPPDIYRRHRLISYTDLYISTCVLTESFPSFPAYVDNLAAQSPDEMRAKVLEWIYKPEYTWAQPPDADTLIRDREAYLGLFDRLHAKKLEEKPEERDNLSQIRAYYVEAHGLLQDAPALQKLVVEHLRYMWTHWLGPEWARVLPMLQESVDAFWQLDYRRMTALEAIRTVTGRDLSGIWDKWGDTIIFIPSAHLGPYVSWMEADGITRLIFGARLPEGARITSPALSRSELLVRLSALSDDTRLRILELLTKHEELCAQDVIERLDLSQSAASRHLRQLTATGYLIERRREVAKCYSLNPQRVDDTLQALKRFLRK